jgi:hypothetical protein
MPKSGENLTVGFVTSRRQIRVEVSSPSDVNPPWFMGSQKNETVISAAVRAASSVSGVTNVVRGYITSNTLRLYVNLSSDVVAAELEVPLEEKILGSLST